MNIFERIKRILKNNDNKTNNISNEITTIDISDVFIPEIDKLNPKDKEKVLKYQRLINIENLDSLIEYNKEFTKEGEKISKLLIKFLYELKSITRKDNKNEEDLNTEYIDLAIKNTKLIVLKKDLKELLDDSILRVVAILEFSKKDKKRIYEFLGVFSKAKRIKRKLQERSLEDAIIRSKLVVKTLTLEYQMVLNSLNSNSNLLDSLYIYNNLKSKVEQETKRKRIYKEKLNYLEKVNSLFDLDLNNLENINLLLDNLKEEDESKIIFNFAILETEIDKFVYDNKDNLMSIFKEYLEELKSIDINISLKEKLLEKIDKLETMSLVLKEFIQDNDLKELYKIKFNTLTIDINTIDYAPIKKTNKKEYDYYKEIISEKINSIITGNSKGIEFYKNNGELRKIIKILNSEFKTNRYYDYKKIIYGRYLLGLLLAFDKEDGLREFYEDYKFLHDVCHDFTNLYENIIDFDWKSELSIDTICQLIDSEVEFDERKETPLFYNLYKIRKKHFYDDSTYKIPEGLIKIGYGFELFKLNDLFDNHYKNNPFIKYIRKNSNGKNVILPSTLREINFPLFYYEDININSLILNDGLKSLCDNCFYHQKIKSISIPSTLEEIGDEVFNFSHVRVLEFRDYKNSILLKELLYSDKNWVKKILSDIILESGIQVINLCDENNELVCSISCDMLNNKTKDKYKLTEDIRFDLNELKIGLNRARHKSLYLLKKKWIKNEFALANLEIFRSSLIESLEKNGVIMKEPMNKVLKKKLRENNM